MAKEIFSEVGSLFQGLQGEEGDRIRSWIAGVVREVMEAEVSAQIGAGRFERSEDRVTQRNGYRERAWDTRAGSLLLRIPKLREGTYFPSFLEPRRRAERALVCVVQEAYVSGISTRAVDDLVKALGMEGMDKSRVSRLCADLDEEAEAFRNRPLTEAVPYLWLDAVYEKVREAGRVVSKAVVIATGVTSKGQRTVLGFAVGAAESGEFWREFLRSLVRRGLEGVQLVISDAHEGLKAAVPQVFTGASWQRCRVHTMRNVLSSVPRGQQAMVAATVRTIFAQPSQDDARRQLGEVAGALTKRCPGAAERLRAAQEDVLAYLAFPSAHWRQIHSTNPLERLNKEIRRRTRVVGIFPTEKALVRLVGMLLAEQDDEWQAASKAYFSQGSMARLTGAPEPPLLLKESATA